MAFFSRLFSQPADPEPTDARIAQRLAQDPPSRLAEGYPRTWNEPLAAAVAALDEAAVMELYAPLDPAGRFHLLQDFSDFFTDERLRDAWLARFSPFETPQAKLLAGMIHYTWAWASRGHGLARSVSDSGHDGLITHNDRARELLLAAGTAWGQSDIVPFLHAQTTAYSMPAGSQGEVARYWQAIDPFNRHGIHAWGAQLDERWFGDDSDQLLLAESVAKNAPAGNEGLAAVPELVMDRWQYLQQFEELDNSDADDRSVKLPRVQDFIRLAYQKLFNSGVSVDPRLEARHLNYFAWCFYWGDQDELAFEAMRRLNGRVYEPVWTHRNWEVDPIEAYNDAREFLIKKFEFGL